MKTEQKLNDVLKIYRENIELEKEIERIRA